MGSLGPGRPAVVSPAYPHMMGEDTKVWTRFLESGDIVLQEVWYDVHVGAMVKGDWEDDSVNARIAAGLTRKRIDVVALVDGRYWVIEVKPLAMHFAIGQVLVYESLFVKEYNPPMETWPVIICDRVDEDVIPECERLGVVVVANL
ncbi:hypothetical protein ES707_10568 [subsurface metagenome]